MSLLHKFMDFFLASSVSVVNTTITEYVLPERKEKKKKKTHYMEILFSVRTADICRALLQGAIM